MPNFRPWSMALAAVFACLPIGCQFNWFAPTTPLREGLNPIEVRDVDGEADARNGLDKFDLFERSEQLRLASKPDVLPPVKNILCLSGGGSYGAYTAGVLVGWTQSGIRPKFDVVTGVSTGALIAPFAFLGSDYDSVLKTYYTTIRDRDVFRPRRTVRTILLATDSFADSSPMAKKIEAVITAELLEKIAAEHAAGRRLYVATTELESRREVIWDLGAIASAGKPGDLELFRNILLASSAIPGFFPPVSIPITVDGVPMQESHVDGSLNHAIYFRAPHVPAELRGESGAGGLYGSNVYVIVAGKLYPDPDRVKLRSLTIAANSVSTVLYSLARGDLARLYSTCVVTGMNYNLAAVPAAQRVDFSPTQFDPEDMTALFESGVAWSTGGASWRSTPPGLEPGEGFFLRTTTDLKLDTIGLPPVNERPRLLIPRASVRQN